LGFDSGSNRDISTKSKKEKKRNLPLGDVGSLVASGGCCLRERKI
jgi:hypothetical protein